MSDNGIERPEVDANPAKAFFVEMLTRDIELVDAILDLLDNCVDGVLRVIGDTSSSEIKPYEGFWAEITFEEDRFVIRDNCGGIPKNIAMEKAFRLGRADSERDKDLPTVGMYGIGMKRAIFKIGKSCVVTSRSGNTAYKVEISPSWLEDDADWYLPLTDLPARGIEKGTTIEIQELLSSINHDFSSPKSNFIRDFKNTVATHYSYILHKGFKVIVREGDSSEEIIPKSIMVKLVEPEEGKEAIAPYLYQGVCNGVDVKLALGFYREFPTVEEVEEDLEGKSARTEDAGWTIICNDRVVVYNDRTKITGWGESGVPKYHTQFISIAGVVHFQCNDAKKLPVTTTKRGIDGNSETYLTIKNIMREGLRHFTSFTNRWKTRSAERDKMFKDAQTVDILQSFDLIPDHKWTQISARQDYQGFKFVPALPTARGDILTRQIQFSRSIADIKLVAEMLLGDPDETPSTVGAECFDFCLKRAKKSR